MSQLKDLPLQEARRLANEQNALAAKRKALVDAESWQERVAERVASDAAAFLALVQKRFPESLEHLTYEAGGYLGCSHMLSIPSANPKVESPLTLTVAINEVLISWVSGWHEHISRERAADQRDKTHLSRAITEIEDLLAERIVAGSRFVEGRLSGGGNLRPGEGIPGDWKNREIRWSDGKPVSIVARSWRGTYDEEWHSGECVTRVT